MDVELIDDNDVKRRESNGCRTIKTEPGIPYKEKIYALTTKYSKDKKVYHDHKKRILKGRTRTRVTPFRQNQSLNSKYQKELVVNATSAEKRMRHILQHAGIKYQFQRGFIGNNFHYIVDFYIPKKNICVEIDGGYHFTKEQQEKDMRRTEFLKSRGQKVVRFTNEEVFDNPEKIVTDIRQAMRKLNILKNKNIVKDQNIVHTSTDFDSFVRRIEEKSHSD